MNKRALRRVIVLLAIALLCTRAADVVVRIAREQVFIAYLPSINVPPPTKSAKRGIGLTYPYPGDVAMVGATWCYTWSPGGNCGVGAEFVPMVWGRSVPTSIAPSAWLLGGNECDQKEQCSTEPDEYVAIWREIETRFGDRKLVAPVPSQLDRDWIVRFRDAYIARYGVSPKFDALAVHCYGERAERCYELVEWFIARADEWKISDGVWLTEFAIPQCWNKDALIETRKLVEWLEDSPRVARYAPFASRIEGDEWWSPQPRECQTPLMRGDTLTELGQLLRGVGQ